MAFALLIVEPVGQRAERSEAEGRAAYQAMVDFGQGLAAEGRLAAVESLSSQAHAVRVSVREGRTALRDGPFAEAKEMVGGFFLLQNTSREEALAIAARCPAAAWATVELRETAPCFDDSRA